MASHLAMLGLGSAVAFSYKNPKGLNGDCFADCFWQYVTGVEPVVQKALNQAFVFVKPHANTDAVRKLVKEQLEKSGCRVTREGEISGKEIDEQSYIDVHYYAIASKAVLLHPRELNVPADKFKEKFGISWSDALSKGVVYNAKGACEKLGITEAELDKKWAAAKNDNKLIKFGGGFYCGLIPTDGEPMYVFNGFFMQMRSKFTAPNTSIHYYTVDFNPAKLKWESFRNDILGGTDPKDASQGSLRRTIFENYESLGLDSEPNVGDNGVHASASPYEGLAERMNWLKVPAKTDAFGKLLLSKGMSLKAIRDCGVDPQVNIGGGKMGSFFDAVEDMDVEPCATKCASLA
eukprot:TRINITY_DN4421_c1_g1_i1.p1 TRINITY_DN4421_c1_g1~~TRINITY_DN4421_c1_g1_i1.p1  ORF type:complete len:348 (+),score=88.35 TRINITY_DN4421_c1_g1_i1:48-1091(+)